MFCKHQWKILNEVKHPSPAQVAVENNIAIDRGSINTLIESVRTDYCCTVCGKFKTVRSDNDCRIY